MKVMRHLRDDNAGNRTALDLRCLLMESRSNGNHARPWMALTGEVFDFLLHLLKRQKHFSRRAAAQPSSCGLLFIK
jgi:hypothetical protein